MIKIGITLLFLITEIVLYYAVDKVVAYPARVLLYIYLAYWYYKERRHNATINLSDKLFIGACFILIVSPIFNIIHESIINKVIEFTLLFFSQQLIISIFIREGAKIDFSNQRKTFKKVMIPYIVLPVLFFLFVALPTKQMIPTLLFGFYLLQMIYLTTLSAFAPFSEKSKFYLALSMGFLILSSGADFIRRLDSPYEYDFAVVRITAVAYRVFLLIGLLNRETHETEKSYLR